MSGEAQKKNKIMATGNGVYIYNIYIHMVVVVVVVVVSRRRRKL